MTKRTEGYIKFNNYETKDDCLNAMDQFKAIHGHYPSSIELDKSDFLPSAKTVQRKFGGLKKLKQELGIDEPVLRQKLDINNFHSKVDIMTILSKKYQPEAIQRFPDELNVELKINVNKSVSNNIAHNITYIDFLYPSDKKSFIGCVNAKQNKLGFFEEGRILLIVMNKHISQKDIDTFMETKKNKMPDNIKVLAYTNATNVL